MAIPIFHMKNGNYSDISCITGSSQEIEVHFCCFAQGMRCLNTLSFFADVIAEPILRALVSTLCVQMERNAAWTSNIDAVPCRLDKRRIWILRGWNRRKQQQQKFQSYLKTRHWSFVHSILTFFDIVFIWFLRYQIDSLVFKLLREFFMGFDGNVGMTHYYLWWPASIIHHVKFLWISS